MNTKEMDAEYIAAQYDSSVAYMDMCINQILETLKDVGAEDDTMQFISSS